MKTTKVLAIFFCALIPFYTYANDICVNAISLTIDDCTFFTFDSDDFTESANPTLELDCGRYNYGFKDFWFKVVVPNSGNLSIEVFEDGSNYNRNVFQAYKGDCNFLVPLACSQNSSVDFGRIELSSLTPGEIVFLRFIPPVNIDSGSFEICTYDTLPTKDCDIQLVLLGEKGECDPMTNTFEQELVIYFSHNVELTNIRYKKSDCTTSYIEEPITSNPMIITLNLSAVGREINYTFIANLTSQGSNICADQSYYSVELEIQALQECYYTEPINNECSSAIQIPILDVCDTDIEFEFIGADPSSYGPHACSIDPLDLDSRDLWYKVIVPPSGEILIDVRRNLLGCFSPKISIFKGNCESLEFIDPTLSPFCTDGYYKNLTPNDTLYLRVSDASNEREGKFKLCITNLGITDFDYKCTNAFEINIKNNCEPIRISPYIFTEAVEDYPNECVTNADSDFWLYFNPEYNFQYEISYSRVDLGSGAHDIEVYRGTCFNLEKLSCEKFYSSGLLSYNHPIFLRFVKRQYVYLANTFEICAKYLDVNCEEHIDLVLPLSDTKSYNASNTINITSELTQTAMVKLTAGNSIDFLPGFEIKLNGELSATIDDCEF